ncbi:MAG TPA: glycosyltransferase family 4 protein [Candidatus Dormibacteraeota bacterium]|nr:glycosyltransferase family 4 protein [Candidatus Dormibacteraeota bacterium]
MSRVAVVVVRFGAGITGGAERHARLVATRLAERGHDVTVLTTCAEDYVTWANVLPPGESSDGPLRVLRFPVDTQRDLERWGRAMQPILDGCWDDHDEATLLREQGPDVRALLDHLRDHGTDYDAVVFFTLLYLPAVAGLPLVADRAILVPTLHDEPAAHLDAQARALNLARRVMWNTPEERDLASRILGVEDVPGAIAGVGVDPPDSGDGRSEPARARFGLERPYFLYAGRVDPDKGCGEMFDHFLAWSRHDGRADLVLAGGAWMDIPSDPRVRHLGFLDPDDLAALMAGATATVVPSRNESLSMAALESLACGVPVLVTSASPVLRGHARRSSAGLSYRDGGEFAAAASLLLDRPEVRDAMGRNGRRYVAANFRWERIMALYDEAITAVSRRRAAA